MAEVPKTPMDNEEAPPASSPANGESDRQVLAPSEGPREELIATAIKFLQNPKVMGSPLHQKKAFLTKKGLTQEEIDLAVERSGVKETATHSSNAGVNPSMPPPPGYQPGMMMPYGQMQPPIPPQSRWAQVRDITVTSVVVASVSYAIYHLYKTYLEPLIRGKTVQEKRLDRLELQVEEIHKSVNDSLTEISRTLAAIQLSITQSQQPGTSQAVGRGITDLKADISSLRSLLLSKNQFPAPPTTAPMLPSWQLAGASSSASSDSSRPSNGLSLSASAPASSKTSPTIPSSDNVVSASAESDKKVEEELKVSNNTQSKSKAGDHTDKEAPENEASMNGAQTS